MKRASLDARSTIVAKPLILIRPRRSEPVIAPPGPAKMEGSRLDTNGSDLTRNRAEHGKGETSENVYRGRNSAGRRTDPSDIDTNSAEGIIPTTHGSIHSAELS